MVLDGACRCIISVKAELSDLWGKSLLGARGVAYTKVHEVPVEKEMRVYAAGHKLEAEKYGTSLPYVPTPVSPLTITVLW